MMWADVVSAICLAVIAVAAITFILFVRDLRRSVPDLRRLTEQLSQDGKPILSSLRTLVDDAGKAVSVVRSEIDGVAKTSKGLRERVEHAAESVEDRLQDLDALLDVVQEEVEDVALDIAAAMRTTRRGGRLVRMMKRKLLGRRR